MTLESVVEHARLTLPLWGEAQASHHKLELDQCTAAATPPHTSQFNNQNNIIKYKTISPLMLLG